MPVCGNFFREVREKPKRDQRITAMRISDSISRMTDYYSRHGFRATVRRARVNLSRAFFANRMVVFYCDLREQSATQVNIQSSSRVERVANYGELSPQDLEDMTSFWSPKLAHRNMRERFVKGASLWLIRSRDKLAGYGWTLQGRTIEPYYFPLAPEDVHLFDFHVFPQYRGRGLNAQLVTQILHNLATNCDRRAFIEAAEWNQAQLTSLQKTPFRCLGLARSFTIFDHTFVSWTQKETTVPLQKGVKQRDKALTMARRHES